MLVYISVCSLIGSISVVFTQGLGSAIVHTITYKDENQFKNWFIYLVLGIVIVTLVIEIVYLNKALNLFNTALVTPTYYVIFTTMTIISSIVLYRGFDASPVDVATCCLGFLSICSGVALLHNSKSDLENAKAILAASKRDVDDEKILLDEQPPVRRKSVFEMFESKSEHQLLDEDTHANHGSQNPGAADLFPAPFSGISRYASTTKRSQSIINKNRQMKSANSAQALSTVANTPLKKKARPHSNTISIDNSGEGQEGYHREFKYAHEVNTPPGQYHSVSNLAEQARGEDEQDQKETNAFSVFTRKHSSSQSSTHRAQDDLDPLSTFKLQIRGGEPEDREGLVAKEEDWNTNTLK